MSKFYNMFSGRKLTALYWGGFENISCLLNVPSLYRNAKGTLKENRKHLTLPHWFHTAHTQKKLYLCKKTIKL